MNHARKNHKPPPRLGDGIKRMILARIEEKVERGREERMGIQKHSPFMTSPPLNPSQSPSTHHTNAGACLRSLKSKAFNLRGIMMCVRVCTTTTGTLKGLASGGRNTQKRE